MTVATRAAHGRSSIPIHLPLHASIHVSMLACNRVARVLEAPERYGRGVGNALEVGNATTETPGANAEITEECASQLWCGCAAAL
jgi:hypothetical protein